MISASGYAPDFILYCSECGKRDLHSYPDGRVKCADCGLSCYIIEAQDSHPPYPPQDDP